MSNTFRNTIWNLKDENNEKFSLAGRRVLTQIGDIVFVAKYVYTWDKMSGKLLKDFFRKKYNVSICFDQRLKTFDILYKNFAKYLYLRNNYKIFVDMSVVYKVVKDERKLDIDSCIRSETK